MYKNCEKNNSTVNIFYMRILCITLKKKSMCRNDTNVPTVNIQEVRRWFTLF